MPGLDLTPGSVPLACTFGLTCLMLNSPSASGGFTAHSHNVARLGKRQNTRGVPNNSECFTVE